MAVMAAPLSLLDVCLRSYTSRQCIEKLGNEDWLAHCTRRGPVDLDYTLFTLFYSMYYALHKQQLDRYG